MADDNKAEISIGAKIDDAVSAIAELQKQFQDFSLNVSSHLKDTAAASDALLAKIKELGAGFLSLEGIKKAVQETVDLGIEARKLATVFGVTQAEGSQMAVALDNIHSSAEQALHSVSFLSRQLRANEENLNRLGLVTRDSNHQIKEQKELYLGAIDVVNSYKQGTDRNAVAIQMFGRNALDLQDMLRLTGKQMEEAKERADALGLTLTEQGAETVMGYRDAMQEAGDVTQGMSKVLGEALMPVLTDVLNWFSKGGSDAIGGFTLVVRGLMTVVNSLVLAFQTGFEIIATVVRVFTSAFLSTALVWQNLLSLNFEEAKRNWIVGMKDLGDIVVKGVDNMTGNAQRYKERLNKLWNPDMTPAGETGAPGTKTYTPRNQNLLAQLEAELAMLKAHYEHESALAGNFQKFSLGQEADFWGKALDSGELSAAEQAKVTQKYWQLQTQMAEQSYAAQLLTIAAAAEAYKDDLDTRLSYAQKIADMQAKAFGPDSPQAQAALKQVNDLKRQIEQRTREIVELQAKAADDIALKQIDENRSALDFQVQAYQLSKLQELEALKAQLGDEYALRQAALDRQITAAAEAKDFDLKAYADLTAQKEVLDKEWEGKRSDLERQSALEAAKYHLQARGNIEGAFAGFFEQLLPPWKKTVEQMGIDLFNALTKAIWDAFSQQAAARLFGAGGVFGGAIDSILGAIGLPGVAGAGGQAAATAALTTSATALGVSASALEVSGVELGLAGDGLSIAALSLNEAAVALTASAAASTASDAGSWIGTVAAVAAFAAPGGFDVPAGLSPVTKLHPREMVLPEHLADTVRDMAAGGGGGGDVHLHFSGPVFDHQGFARYVAQAVKSQYRNFNPELAGAS